MSDTKTVLIILRHAHAAKAKAGQDDYDRPLDDRGRRQAAEAGRSLLALGQRPDRIVCSGSARTRQTLTHLGRDFEAAVTVFDDGLYSGGLEGYLAASRASAGAGCVMLVGHNPSIEEFVAFLTGDGDAEALRRLADGAPKGAFARVEIAVPLASIAKGVGFLSHFVAPAR